MISHGTVPELLGFGLVGIVEGQPQLLELLLVDLEHIGGCLVVLVAVGRRDRVVVGRGRDRSGRRLRDRSRC